MFLRYSVNKYNKSYFLKGQVKFVHFLLFETSEIIIFFFNNSEFFKYMFFLKQFRSNVAILKQYLVYRRCKRKTKRYKDRTRIVSPVYYLHPYTQHGVISSKIIKTQPFKLNRAIFRKHKHFLTSSRFQLNH